MKLTDLFHEDAQADARFNKKARNLTFNLMNYMQKGKVDFVTSVKGEDHYAIKPEHIDSFPADMIILLGKPVPGHRGMSGAFWKFKEVVLDKYYYALIVNGLDDFSPESITKLGRSLEFREVVLHEIIHYFDNIRSDGRTMATKKYSDPSDRKAYYNDPAEFNAYFHNAADRLLAFISDAEENPNDIADIADIYGIDMDFYKTMANIFGGYNASFHVRQFVGWLNKKNNQRMMRRLYKLHDEAKKILRGGVVKENEDEHWDALEKTGFFGKRGAGCIFIARDTGRILLAHRSELVEQPHTWGGWGGAIDQHESPLEAVKREAQEEAGFVPKDEDIIPIYVFHDQKSGFKYFNFIVLVDEEFEPRLNWETQDFKWVEFGKWPQPLHFGIQAILNDDKSVKKIVSKRLYEHTRHTGFLYKGTTSLHIPQIIEHGLNGPSYWGTEAIASYYAMEASIKNGGEPVILQVDIGRFDAAALDPDHNSIDTPLLSVIDYDESEVQDEWKNSNQDWNDSLRIVGAVIYRKRIIIDDTDIIYPDPDDLEF